MHVLLVFLIVLQTASSTVKPKYPIVQNSAGSSAANTPAKNSAGQLPPTKSKSAGIPSTPQPTPDQSDKKQGAPDRIYKVDVVSPPAKPLDTPLFPIYLLITGVGVFVNLWVGIMLFKQSKLLRHQVLTAHISTKAAVRSAQAAKESADAAARTSQAVINAERAFLLITYEVTREKYFKFNATNHGRTPGEILIVEADWRWPTHHMNLPVPPQYKFADNERSIHTRFVPAAGTDKDFYGWDLKLFLDTDWDLLQEIEASKKQAVIYGRVIYLDILKERHETRFCYRYNPLTHELDIGGPLGYNDHT
jgi:hypothetical protein